jgi:hypothetical protein
MRAMHKTILTVLLVSAPATAVAGGSSGSIGVGAELSAQLTPDVSVNYDAGAFHVGGAVGFSDDRGGGQNDFRVAGRFYYHLHATALADFGVGGELQLRDQEGDDNTFVDIIAGFQIRSFISTNVALSFAGGITIGVADSDGVSIGGQPVGIAGVHYYFF